MSKKKKLTTAAGRPYYENEDSMTVGRRGPILLQDIYLQEKLAHFKSFKIGLYGCKEIIFFRFPKIRKSSYHYLN